MQQRWYGMSHRQIKSRGGELTNGFGGEMGDNTSAANCGELSAAVDGTMYVQ